MTAPPALDIWYVCDQTLCNFDCAYCVTQVPRRAAGRKMWASDEGPDRFYRILEWLAGLPWRIRVRLQTLGEPFVSREFLDGAARLTHAANVEFVELVTNGSFTPKQFQKLATVADLSRLSLWITYHHGQIDPARLVAAAVLARDLGASVVVHALLFPDTIESVEALLQRCRRARLRTDVTAGHNANDAYPGRGHLPIVGQRTDALRLYRHQGGLEAMARAHNGVRGEPCSSGYDYLYVHDNGDVYPCRPYSHAVPESRLGNALDAAFLPRLRATEYAPCRYDGVCSCKEDYLHLAVARDNIRTSRSLGYYRPRRRGVSTAVRGNPPHGGSSAR